MKFKTSLDLSSSDRESFRDISFKILEYKTSLDISSSDRESFRDTSFQILEYIVLGVH